ncbi:MAG: hypothetical protein FJW23_17320 [Acidimicrobiia bacterium]|nr:hypothetical protein [Acidimicrobiia bacterium]
MNGSGEMLEPDPYLHAVLSAYTHMPETPLQPSAGDRTTAQGLLARGVPLHTVRTALVLASLRRLARPPDHTPLQPVRSLAYFLPVIDELQDNPVSDDYATYLATKLNQVAPAKLTRRPRQTGNRPENYVSS